MCMLGHCHRRCQLALFRFIAGRPRKDFPALCKWLGALKLIRTNEQETEAGYAGNCLDWFWFYDWLLC